MNKLILALFAICIGSQAWAQEEMTLVAQNEEQPAEGKPDLAYPDKNKRIQLNFSDELVQGASANTDVTFMDKGKGLSMKKLIRLRENFNSNMEKSKNEFKSR